MNQEAIQLDRGDLAVEIWPLGARLNGVWYLGKENLVASSGIREDALDARKYHGAVVGPVANRIAGGAATIDGQTYHFEKNERQQTTLHSGATGAHAQDWKTEYQDDIQVRLHLFLPDGEGGFPGNRSLTAHYRLIDNGLQVGFEAGSDAPTWVNLALHPYWALGRNGRSGQRICVNADTYLPVDEMQIPTGEIAKVSNTQFDLRKLSTPSTEIDHNFCLNASDGPAIQVESDAGLGMEITTDAPGVQIYTGKEIGIAIEPQHWPDAMHHPRFPSIELRPGELYSQNSTYRFSRL